MDLPGVQQEGAGELTSHASVVEELREEIVRALERTGLDEVRRGLIRLDVEAAERAIAKHDGAECVRLLRSLQSY